jgi:uncharacterized membrane protein YeaQ/YmgE (transglycosylase-associated protein family)
MAAALISPPIHTRAAAPGILLRTHHPTRRRLNNDRANNERIGGPAGLRLAASPIESELLARWNNGDRPALPGTFSRESAMHLSNQSLLVIIIVGIVAGYLAGRVMEGGGFGLIGDLLVGLVGAFIGDWLMPQLGIHLGVGIVALIINAFIGAVVLLLLLRLIGRGGGYGGWGRRRI